jgi:hypothetical protein
MNPNALLTTILLVSGSLASPGVNGSRGLVQRPPAAPLDEMFQNPPEGTKPWCYWYWLNGDVSKDGITKDLEAMANVGIKLAMIGNIHGQGGKDGPVKMLTPQWYELTLHAFREANRLSVDLMMFNAPGWSQSGGPWIRPEQSMRRVAWSESPASGGAFSQKVRPDGILPGQDIAVIAVPRIPAVTITGQPASSSPDGGSIVLGKSSWIWQPGENAVVNAPVGSRHFKRQTDFLPDGRRNSASASPMWSSMRARQTIRIGTRARLPGRAQLRAHGRAGDRESRWAGCIPPRPDLGILHLSRPPSSRTIPPRVKAQRDPQSHGKLGPMACSPARCPRASGRHPLRHGHHRQGERPRAAGGHRAGSRQDEPAAHEHHFNAMFGELLGQ